MVPVAWKAVGWLPSSKRVPLIDHCLLSTTLADGVGARLYTVQLIG